LSPRKPYDPQKKAREFNHLVDRVIRGLNNRKGVPIKSTEIIKALKSEGIKIGDEKLREVIHHIRVNHLLRGLASSPTAGYWIEQDPGKLMQCVQDLQNRYKSIKEVADALAKDVVLFSQTNLPA
jgi:hypothetical protein